LFDRLPKHDEAIRLTTTFIIPAQVGSTTAVNLRLFKRADACTSNGIICQNILQGTCCANVANKQLYGSAQAENGGSGDVAAPFTKRGDLYCGVQIGLTKPIPICFVTNLEQSYGGIAWEHQGGRKRMAQQMAPCTKQVEGDEIYSDGVKTYVISKDKMTRIELVRPEGEEELLAWFKQHADTVLDEQTNVPVEKAEVAAPAEK
jgi:hypothetical protein